MPTTSGSRNGTLYLDRDPVATHVAILADSGITYVAAWFECPERWLPLQPTAVLDSIWPQVTRRVGDAQLHEAAPLATTDTNSRSGWFVNSMDIRLGMVIHLLGDRVVLLNAATPEAKLQERQMHHLRRFLNSFQAGDQPS